LPVFAGSHFVNRENRFAFFAVKKISIAKSAKYKPQSDFSSAFTRKSKKIRRAENISWKTRRL
jgi:hypothetical protein